MPKTTDESGPVMAKKKIIADEIIVSALLSCPTLEAAAAQCGLSVRQLYERRQSEDFTRKLREAQADALAGTVRYLQQNTATAASTLVEICEHGQEQNRLTAARTLLDQAARLSEIVDFAERLEALEQVSRSHN